ncbi:energy-coupled thiamine transporter ThiT [Anaerofustis stercorihominis]|uniref:energy-coupled thiamine transporter ThiT n=1 Tax=Anaerofustis stercorihominis TaxID=214853 RepID=UPI00214CF7F6|nr:energy-coupled thiamine transporter ThiT [Anaerofustis stercorihominis]MCR2033454.1 energy-coupled thiamine transporter ThiT [Anaerofustis stercorihominis]
MSFFITSTDNGYVLKSAGYIALVILFLSVLCIATFLSKKREQKRKNTKELVYCAMIIALGTVASFLKVYEFPFGGTVTLCSMLFVCLAGYFYGPATGVLTASAYGILQFIVQPYIVFPLQVLVDYLFAFGSLGLSGLFYKSKNGLLKGYLIGVLGRYLFAVISGWIFFSEYAWEGWAALPYSLVYNGIYIGAEALLTVIIISVPAVKKGLERIKINA